MPSTPIRAQPTISTYFSVTPQKSKKRPSTHIDLTLDDDDEEQDVLPSKRPRLFENMNAANTRPSSVETPSKARSTAVADNWRFSPEKQTEAGPSKPRTEVEKERHESFKKKLLQENSTFLRTISNVGSEPGDAIDVDGLASEDASEDDEDSRFEKLSVMFSHKGKGKANVKAPAKAKKLVDIGPSGQSYTPLEKQVS